MGPIRIRIFSSHPLASERYTHLLRAPDFALMQGGQFDVAVFDSNLTNIDAFVAEARNTCPAMRAIVLAESTSQDACLVWAQRGFWGVVPYNDCERNLGNAIRQVSRGQMFLPSAVAARLMVAEADRERCERASAFTQRERQVFDRVLRGQSYKEIGAALRITERTVKFHAASIFRKLRIHSRNELAQSRRRSADAG